MFNNPFKKYNTHFFKSHFVFINKLKLYYKKVFSFFTKFIPHTPPIGFDFYNVIFFTWCGDNMCESRFCSGILIYIYHNNTVSFKL